MQNKMEQPKNKNKLTATINNATQYMVKNKHIVFRGAIIVVVVVVLIVGLKVFIGKSTPYAIKIDGTSVCCVNGKDDAREVITNIVEKYTPKGTTFKTFDMEGRIEFKKEGFSTNSDVEKVSASEATQIVLETIESSEKPFNIKVASVGSEIKPYTPEPNYIKDKKMLAGESRVVKKGVKGKQRVSTTYVSVNGKVETKKVSSRQVLEEGKPGTTAKGILGLPKGENWETYTGLPVYKDGKELVTTSKKYLGAPYKYGGYSLTKGIDCVQFVRQMYAKYGIRLPNNHHGIQNSGVKVSYNKAKKGDIVCYNNHMGIYVGKGKMINATHNGGVRITKVKKGRIKTIRRVVK